MTVFAVTGHMDLTEDSVPLVRAALRGLLTDEAHGDMVGVSCLAKGADSVFAEVVLELGGRLVVVLPSRDYRRAEVGPDDEETFDRLLAAADETVVLRHEQANRTAYEEANSALLERADRLVAVWNGAPPSGRGGGTADTVLEARAAGLPVDVVWPEGAVRA